MLKWFTKCGLELYTILSSLLHITSDIAHDKTGAHKLLILKLLNKTNDNYLAHNNDICCDSYRNQWYLSEVRTGVVSPLAEQNFLLKESQNSKSRGRVSVCWSWEPLRRNMGKNWEGEACRLAPSINSLFVIHFFLSFFLCLLFVSFCLPL